MAKSSVVSITKDIKVDAKGNKVVEPIYWGAGGCVGGTVAIKR